MRVAKWGNSLAVRLPKKLVDDLKLAAGDEVALQAIGPKTCGIEKRDRGREFLEALKQFRFELPLDYKFDRDEANER